VEEIQVQDNDLILMGSDGLFDNLEEEEIKNILRPFIRFHNEIADTELVANLIGESAVAKYMRKDYSSQTK